MLQSVTCVIESKLTICGIPFGAAAHLGGHAYHVPRVSAEDIS
jgi:hypothetical protein